MGRKIEPGVLAAVEAGASGPQAPGEATKAAQAEPATPVTPVAAAAAAAVVADVVAAKPRAARKAKPARAVAKVPQPAADVKPDKAASKPNAPVKAVKPETGAEPVKDKEEKGHAKPKLVRDSFTMPRADFALIAVLKDRALGFKRPAKKSELLRAGLHALAALDDVKLQAALAELAPVKAGRPKKA